MGVFTPKGKPELPSCVWLLLTTKCNHMRHIKCQKCGRTVPAGFFKHVKKKDGSVIRPGFGKRCLVIPMCGCWMR